MRIVSEDGRRISPSEFIPVAEETGLIIKTGEWALMHVFQKINEWLETGYSVGHVSVNVSGIQLKQFGFVEYIEKLVEEFHMNPNYIELEITESIMLDNQRKILLY